MQGFWLFLTIALDIYPFVLLQYLPLKNKLKFGYTKTILACSLVMLVQFWGFVWCVQNFDYSFEMISLHRFSSYIPMAIFTFIFTRKEYAKCVFIFGLIFPYDAFILTLGAYIASFVSSDVLFMYSSLSRLCLSVITFPFMLHFFKKQLIPIMNVQDDSVWKYAWAIPLSLTVIATLFINPAYEIEGISVNEVIAYTFMFFSTIAVCILLFHVLKNVQEKAENEGRSQMLLSVQEEQYQRLMDNIEKTKQSRHDLRHQLSLIGALVKNGEYDKLTAYIDEHIGSVPLDTPFSICENFAVNAIATHYIALAKEHNIELLLDFNIGNTIKIKNTDLCIIIGNCMENAIEACLSVFENKRIIRSKAKQFGNQLAITFDNSFDGDIKQQGTKYLSKKRGFESEGVGLSSVKAVVSKYGGQMEINHTDKEFRISLLLYN